MIRMRRIFLKLFRTLQKTQEKQRKRIFRAVFRNEVFSPQVKTVNTDPLGHDWDEGEIIQKPTCTEKGIMLYTCLRDPSHTKIRKIKKTGHNWTEWVVTREPTYTRKGEKTRYCLNDPDHIQTKSIPRKQTCPV